MPAAVIAAPLAYTILASPLADAFLTAPSLGILDEDVVDTAPLNQAPPLGTRVGKKCDVWPQPEPVDKSKRLKVGMPLPKKQRPVASG
jgi:hypothetical protein